MAVQGQRFGAICADPPWTFLDLNGESAIDHYGCMDIESIAALPIQALAADDCVLFLWVTNPTLASAFRVIEAWGFQYKTVAFTWVKQIKSDVGKISAPPLWFMGNGYWTRANPELCLLATRGKPKRKAKDVRQLVIAPVGKHSRKPDEVSARIERLVDGPYLELFGRRSMEGWTVWGNQVEHNLWGVVA